jgi:hypothetical protein
VTIQVGDEDPSNRVGQGDETPTAGPKNGHSEAGTHRYDVGPGFEIAVRSDIANPVQLTIKKDDEGGRGPPKGASAEHRLGEIEKRLDSIERALLTLVDQMKRIEDRLPK